MPWPPFAANLPSNARRSAPSVSGSHVSGRRLSPTRLVREREGLLGDRLQAVRAGEKAAAQRNAMAAALLREAADRQALAAQREALIVELWQLVRSNDEVTGERNAMAAALLEETVERQALAAQLERGLGRRLSRRWRRILRLAPPRPGTSRGRG
jgi:hypothetical protein